MAIIFTVCAVGIDVVQHICTKHHTSNVALFVKPECVHAHANEASACHNDQKPYTQEFTDYCCVEHHVKLAINDAFAGKTIVPQIHIDTLLYRVPVLEYHDYKIDVKIRRLAKERESEPPNIRAMKITRFLAMRDEEPDPMIN